MLLLCALTLILRWRWCQISDRNIVQWTVDDSSIKCDRYFVRRHAQLAHTHWNFGERRSTTIWHRSRHFHLISATQLYDTYGYWWFALCTEQLTGSSFFFALLKPYYITSSSQLPHSTNSLIYFDFFRRIQRMNKKNKQTNEKWLDSIRLIIFIGKFYDEEKILETKASNVLVNGNSPTIIVFFSDSQTYDHTTANRIVFCCTFSIFNKTIMNTSTLFSYCIF